MIIEVLYPAFLILSIVCIIGAISGMMLISDKNYKVGWTAFSASMIIGLFSLFLGFYGMRINDYPTCPKICQKATVNQFYNAEKP